MLGVIRSIPSKAGKQANYAFIKGEDGKEYFLHISELLDTTWADMKATIAVKREALVEFEVVSSLKGLRAAKCYVRNLI